MTSEHFCCSCSMTFCCPPICTMQDSCIYVVSRGTEGNATKTTGHINYGLTINKNCQHRDPIVRVRAKKIFGDSMRNAHSILQGHCRIRRKVDRPRTPQIYQCLLLHEVGRQRPKPPPTTLSRFPASVWSPADSTGIFP